MTKRRKLMDKKGQAGSLFGIFIGLMLVIGVFSAFFLFYKEEVQYSDYGVSPRINNTFNNLTQQLDDINDTVTDVRESALKIAETKTGGVGGLVVTTTTYQSLLAER